MWRFKMHLVLIHILFGLVIICCVPLSDDSGIDGIQFPSTDDMKRDLYSQLQGLLSKDFLHAFGINGNNLFSTSHLTKPKEQIIDTASKEQGHTNEISTVDKLHKPPSDEDLEKTFKFDLTYGHFGTCTYFPSFSEEPLYMVTRCPMNFFNPVIISYCQASQKKNLDKCVIDMENIPVQDGMGVVYKNIYCSMCFRAKNVSAWTVDLESNDISVVKVIDRFQSVNIMENLGEIANCTQRIYPFRQHDIIHCNPNEEKGSRKFMARDVDPNVGKSGHSEFLLSFQIFINFGINGKGHVIFSTEPVHPLDVHDYNCRANEVYYKGACREVTCDKGYHFENYNCRPDVQTFVDSSDDAKEAIDKLKYMNDLLNVTLRLNVSRTELILLDQPGANEIVLQKIASLLNVSSSRIRNLTLECDAGVVKGGVLEVHPVSETHYNVHVNDGENSDGFDNNSYLSVEEMSDGTTFTSQSTNDEIFPDQFGNELLNCNINEKNAYEFSYGNTFTVAMHFELVGGRKKSAKYVSAQHMYNNMKDLINSKSFNLMLNGTDLHITEYVENENATKLDSWCVHGQQEEKDGNDVKVTTFNDTRTGKLVKGIYINSTNRYYGPDMFDLYVMVSGEIGSITNMTTVAFVYLCNEPRIESKDCAKITAEVTDYSIFAENNSVLFENEVFNVSQYEYKNDKSHDILICIPDQRTDITQSHLLYSSACGSKFGKVVKAEGYLSFILGVISIIVTFAVLITYCLIEKLRNLPGLNTMNLTLSIFLGELLFITSGVFGSQSQWLCQMFGITLHYFFLASFFWMNVMSYDVFRTFANKCILARVRNVKKYLPRYAAYAWGSPAVIVGICSFIDFSGLFQNIRIGYGSCHSNDNIGSSNISANTSSSENIENSRQNLGCWIQEPVASLVAFGLPMVIILTSNAIMFTRTIICIRRTSKLAKFKTRRSSRSSPNQMTGKDDVILYVRMSTMMGFTWTLGLASSIVSALAGDPTDTVCIVLHTLGILFVAFNCSQGLFIFFAFVFNRRVGGYYKDLFRGYKECLSHKTITSATSNSTLYTTGSVSSSLDKL